MKIFPFKIICLLLMCEIVSAADFTQDLGLQGLWRFKIGNDKAYTRPDYDDASWETIPVPGCWEDNGFPGYDGYAWYRCHFKTPEVWRKRHLFLNLGQIDDVDVVYINGHFLAGTGNSYPEYYTAFDFTRHYLLRSEFLDYGQENLIAVRVYDGAGCGGIIGTSIGIFSYRNAPEFLFDLTGDWKFQTGDNSHWAEPEFNDSGWENIIVPTMWEAQSYSIYNGYAWYRKSIVIRSELSTQKMILFLGKIDDYNEIYFNGVRIGRTGLFPPKHIDNDYCKQERFYFLPQYLIQWNRKNTIAVRVYDIGGRGGIYEGPVGIMTREEYNKYIKQR